MTSFDAAPMRVLVCGGRDYGDAAYNACLKAPDLDRMSRIAARYNRLIARIPKELDHAGEDKP